MVWSPKYRRNVLVDGVDERLKSILVEVAEAAGIFVNTESWHNVIYTVHF